MVWSQSNRALCEQLDKQEKLVLEDYAVLGGNYSIHHRELMNPIRNKFRDKKEGVNISLMRTGKNVEDLHLAYTRKQALGDDAIDLFDKATFEEDIRDLRGILERYPTSIVKEGKYVERTANLDTLQIKDTIHITFYNCPLKQNVYKYEKQETIEHLLYVKHLDVNRTDDANLNMEGLRPVILLGRQDFPKDIPDSVRINRLSPTEVHGFLFGYETARLMQTKYKTHIMLTIINASKTGNKTIDKKLPQPYIEVSYKATFSGYYSPEYHKLQEVRSHLMLLRELKQREKCPVK
jgi:hypothetical protein